MSAIQLAVGLNGAQSSAPLTPASQTASARIPPTRTRVRALIVQALAEQLLALLCAPARMVLHAPKEPRELGVTFSFGVLRVLVEPPGVLETQLRDGDQVVVLVLRA